MFISSRFSIPVALSFIVAFLLLGNFDSFAQTQKYRLLVVITPAAYNAYGSANVQSNIKNYIISNANVRYANSKALVTVELAGIVKLNYTESVSGGISRDLDSLTKWLRNSSNTVSVLRTLYRADVVTMVEDNSDWGTTGGIGGIAWVLDATTEAFSCLAYDGINNYPIAAHEIGHNFGCRHDTTQYNGNSPFTYGHGYIMPNGIDGDVMSYPNTYQPWFSNPDSLFGGLPRGTALRCNTTRVLNEQIGTIAGYFVTQPNVIVSGITWKASDYGDVMANDSITTSGADSLKDSSVVRLRATKKVVLNSGLYVARNSSLTISTGTTALAKIRSGDGGGFQQPSLFEKSVVAFSAKVSMAGKSIRVNLSMPVSSPVSITVVDLSGRLLIRESMNEQTIGQHEYILGLREKIANKVYFVKVETPLFSKRMKLIMLR